MARAMMGSRFNIAQLEQFLDERRTQLEELREQRTELESKLTDVDRQINKLEGAAGRKRSGGSGGGRGTRAHNERPLPDVMEDVMREHGGPMRVGEITEAVQAAGYKSNSDNFKGIVNQALIKDRKRFGVVERGVYQLKKPSNKEAAG